jgi:hypothetical protein
MAKPTDNNAHGVHSSSNVRFGKNSYSLSTPPKMRAAQTTLTGLWSYCLGQRYSKTVICIFVLIVLSANRWQAISREAANSPDAVSTSFASSTGEPNASKEKYKEMQNANQVSNDEPSNRSPSSNVKIQEKGKKQNNEVSKAAISKAPDGISSSTVFFDVSPPPLSPKPARAIEPGYTCNSPEEGGIRSTKIAFVHIFKTAGSTMRTLFKEYAETCGAGEAIIVNCANVLSNTVNTSTVPMRRAEPNASNNTIPGLWYNQKRRAHCRLKYFKPRQYNKEDDRIISSSKVSNMTVSFALTGGDTGVSSTFLGEQVDMMLGHFPLGTQHLIPAWADDTERSLFSSSSKVQIQYVAFFRNAAMKYISGCMYRSNPKLTLEDHVERIAKNVKEGRAQKRYYQGYYTYLLTPNQVEYISENKVNMTAESSSNLIRNNLLHFNVLIGVVERMDETLQMMHYMLDAENEVPSLFAKYGMTSTLRDVASPARRNSGDSSIDAGSPKMSNVAAVSSGSVLAELQKDAEVYEMLTEYVKYEQQITEYAGKIHKAQYQRIVQGLKGIDAV